MSSVQPYLQRIHKDIVVMISKQSLSLLRHDRPISPCGACRQVMSELMPAKANVILLSNKDEVAEYTIEQLLPYSFTSEDFIMAEQTFK